MKLGVVNLAVVNQGVMNQGVMKRGAVKRGAVKRGGMALALLVRAYQLALRPLLPPACRFTPSCSAYAIEALHTHGALRGMVLAAWRIVRCNPFCACGYDPVPDPAAYPALWARMRHMRSSDCRHIVPAETCKAP